MSYQVAKLIARISENLPEMSSDIMQGWIENPKALQKALASVLVSPVNGSAKSVQEQIQEWTSFYSKHFGIALGDVAIPDHQPGFDRLIVVAEGLTRNQVYDECAKQFKCWRYADDLDKAVPTNDRDPKNGTYAIWVRDRVEADEENKNLSADHLAFHKAKGITLLERMLYELKCHEETGKHLDVDNWTLCSGSRDSAGGVPSAGWCGDEFRVRWRCADSRDGLLRSRSVVSCQS